MKKKPKKKATPSYRRVTLIRGVPRGVGKVLQQMLATVLHEGQVHCKTEEPADYGFVLDWVDDNDLVSLTVDIPRAQVEEVT